MPERRVGRAVDQGSAVPARRSPASTRHWAGAGDHEASVAGADLASAIGNLETLRRTGSIGVQPKLDVSKPTDAHEVEADRVAEQVMSIPLDRAAAEPEEEEVATRLDRAARAGGGRGRHAARSGGRRARGGRGRDAARSGGRRARGGRGRATTARSPAAAAEPEEEEVATKADGAPAMTPAIESGINTSRAGGQPLDSDTRGFFEPRFGRDLSDTKVHTDAHAARLASDLNAQAFTVGRDIYMAGGKYQPGTESGRSLLAHELTHTVQQQPGVKLRRRPARISVPNPTKASRHVQRANGGAPATGAELLRSRRSTSPRSRPAIGPSIKGGRHEAHSSEARISTATARPKTRPTSATRCGARPSERVSSRRVRSCTSSIWTRLLPARSS